MLTDVLLLIVLGACLVAKLHVLFIGSAGDTI